MKRLAATVAALGTLLVVTAEGAVPERPTAVRHDAALYADQFKARELPVHTQEPVQGARCRGETCTAEPVDVAVIGVPETAPLAG